MITILIISFITAIALSIITVVADIFIKNASLATAFSGWKLLILGCLIYGLTGLGWFYVLRNIKLSTSAVIYGVSCIILLTLVSVFYFKEKISSFEVLGIILAIASIIILARFA